MVEIIPTDMTPPENDPREFHPIRGVGNRHLQIMLPRLIHRKLRFTPHWQRLELPDGDFVDLVWNEDLRQARHKPRLVVFHDLEESLHSPYAYDLIHVTMQRNRLGMVMHFRGCSGKPNRNNRVYRSGETEDGTWFLYWLQREFDPTPTVAVGYLLGGNMPDCLLAEEGDRCPLDAAVIVSAPFMLEACSYHMDGDFSRVCQRYLFNLLKASASRKLRAYPGSLPVDLRQLKGIRRTREFDDMITAKIHGSADALNYYRQCSAMPRLSDIAKPTLITRTKDDPFMDHHSIPPQEQLSMNVGYQLTEQSGHAGFVGGTLHKPETWLERCISDWLNRWLGAPV